MNPSLFFGNFELLADAPNGVQKLRELILQLAVMGKLVPHDPNDEPAYVLLEKIKNEKKKLVKEGKIKGYKLLPDIDDEILFEISESWKWVRFDNICSYIQRGKSPKYVEKSDFPVIAQKCIQWDELKIDRAKFIDPLTVEKYEEERFLRTGDLLWNSTGTGTLGRVKVYVHEENAYDKVVADSHVTVIRPLMVDPYYMYFWIANPIVQNSIESIASGSTNQIELATSTVKNHSLPLPPLAEQKRIVAKVEELMALCDKLEARHQKKQELKNKLNSAALDKMLSAENQEEFELLWQRICENFDLLYDNSENVEKLKQAILQLAVQGKLVPQNPENETAGVLIEKIKEEKDKLAEEGKIKKNESFPEIGVEEIPFGLPERWKWVRLGNLCELITKGSSPKWQGVSYVEKSNGILFITSENVDNYSVKLDKEKYVESKFNEIEPRSILKRNDILMNIVGASIGRTAIYESDEIANINQAVCLIRLVGQNELINLSYLLYFFNSQTCISYMFDKQVDNARANLSMGNISKFVIPFPPLEEQKLIVEKVENLMGLCDELESKLREQGEKSEKLMEASVKNLLEGAATEK